jgi:hypothetical protein
MAPILLSHTQYFKFSLQWYLPSLNTQKPCLHITSSRESGSPRSVHNGLGGLSIHCRNGRWQEWQQGAGITSGGNGRGRDGERRASRPEGGTTTARRRDDYSTPIAVSGDDVVGKV